MQLSMFSPRVKMWQDHPCELDNFENFMSFTCSNLCKKFCWLASDCLLIFLKNFQLMLCKIPTLFFSGLSDPKGSNVFAVYFIHTVALPPPSTHTHTPTHSTHPGYPSNHPSIMKTRLFKYTENFTTKKWQFFT